MHLPSLRLHHHSQKLYRHWSLIQLKQTPVPDHSWLPLLQFIAMVAIMIVAYHTTIPAQQALWYVYYVDSKISLMMGNICFQHNDDANILTVRMRNASGDNSHRMYSFWGTPENCRYIRTLNAKDSWNPSFGTIMVIESSKWCNEGDVISLVVHDRDGFPFTGCCKMHRERSHQTQAFVFRDPYDEERVYRMGVSKDFINSIRSTTSFNLIF